MQLKGILKSQKRILAFLAACIVFVFALANFYNFKNLKDAQKVEEELAVSKIKSGSDAWVDAKFTEINRIKNLLESSNLKESEEIKNFIAKLKGSIDFPYVIVGLDDKRFFISEDSFTLSPEYDPTTRHWYIDTIKANKTVLTPPYLSLRLTKLVIAFCTPIDAFSHKGVLCGGQPLEDIQKYFSSYSQL